MQAAQMDARRYSYWELDLPPEPLPPRNLPPRVDVLIVGAGFMGRWLAYFLGKLKQPPRTLVIERDRFSYGASSRNAGFLTCGQISEMLADAATAGEAAVIETALARLRGMEIVRREFPDFDIAPCGSTDYDEVTDAGRALAAKLNAAIGREVYSERAARLGNDVRPAIFNAADGALHPVKLLRLLQGRAGGAGFEFGVTALHLGDGQAVLESPGGKFEVKYGRAMICTNAFAADFDTSSDVMPGRGQVLVTSKVHTRTDQTLGYMHKGYDYFRFVDGRLLIGGGRHQFATENGTQELTPTAEVAAYLRAQAALVIGHDDWQVEHHWAGIMGFKGGGHLGGNPRKRLDAHTEIIAGFGGMGVALAPVYAEQIAGE